MLPGELWFKVSVQLSRHRKTLSLASRLGIGRHEALGVLHDLWSWTVQYAPSGSLGIDSIQLASALDWRGDPNKLVDALIESEFLDSLNPMRVHDWEDHQSDWMSRRQKDAERQRRHRARREKSKRRGEERVTRDVTMPSRVTTEGANAPVFPSENGFKEALESIVNLWNFGVESRKWIRSTPARLRSVTLRMRDGFTLEQLRKAVVNIKESEFHMGGNDRGWKAPGPEWIFHTRERTEQWVNWEKPKTSEEKLREWARGVDQKGNGHA